MTKLKILAESTVQNKIMQTFADENYFFILGYKKAFLDIKDQLDKEMKLLELYPFMGERMMTLKIYQNKINDVLKEMENEIV